MLMYKKVRETDPENETREAFRVFDAEGLGFIGDQVYLNFGLSEVLPLGTAGGM